MKALDQIDVARLKAAIEALNKATFKTEDGTEKKFVEQNLKTVAITKANMLDSFVKAVEGMDEKIAENLPEVVSKFYNVFVSEAEEDDQPAPVPAAKKEKKPKEPKAPKEKKPKKEKAVLSEYGHKQGSQAAKLDDLLKEGGHTVDEMAQISGRTTLGVRSHIQHLRNDRKLVIEETEDHKFQVKGPAPAAAPAATAAPAAAPAAVEEAAKTE
jgi:hypothetical protein